jgi:alkanesulfonate monooxygenase SsuD/methylene tetrahydromethanopterin reductase-like flavin-dependent oxidoreductase (luciferase family)
MTAPLKFGMYCEFQCPDGVDHGDLIREVMDLAVDLDGRGFDVFSTLEHPFFPRFAVNVNPLALFTALAQRTRNLRFRTLCHTLPLHNPMVLAGEIAQADILTGGRLECGMGRGHAWLQIPANVRFQESQGRFDESLDVLIEGWTKDRFTYHGKYYTCDDLSIVPKPAQKPHPTVFVVGTSGRQFLRAAKNGWGIVVGGPVASPLFFAPMQNYRDLCREHGRTPYIGFIKPVWLDEDENRAYREAREPSLNFVRWNFELLHTYPRHTEAEKQVLRDGGFGFYAEPPFLQQLDWSYEKLAEEEIVLIGRPDRVGRKLLELYDAAGGFDELIIMNHYGGSTHAQSLRTQALFAERIMPVLRAETAARGAV